MPAGRPRSYESPDEMAEVAYKYLETADAPTMAGMCMAMGLTRAGLSRYGQREEFVDTVREIKTAIEAHVEGLLLYGRNPTGPLFWMKNNADYKDTQHTENTHNVRFVLSDKPISEDEWESQQNA